MSEKYEPTPEEIKRAEDSMTEEQKEMSVGREIGKSVAESFDFSLKFPTELWLKGSKDAWLVEEIGKRLATHGSSAWDQAAALGMYMRLEEWPKAIQKELVEKTLQGDASYSAKIAAPLRWLQQLRKQEIKTIYYLGMAVAMRVDGTLDDLQSEYKKNPKCVNDQSWQTRLLDALYERDDLEGVRMILTRAGVTPENDNQRFDFGVAFDFFNDLDLMDHLGNELIQELPPLSILRNNERLRRAHNLDHLAWWAKPAGHPSETAENN